MGERKYPERIHPPGPAYTEPASIEIPAGFVFGAANSHVRGTDWVAADTAVFAGTSGCNWSARWTRNAVKAAPVLHLAQQATAVSALRAAIVNSGNANACTGAAGTTTVQEMCQAASQLLGCQPAEITPMSTGVIGRAIAPGTFQGVPQMELGSTHADVVRAARAICTTDRYAKIASTTLTLSGGTTRLLVVAKGAGMIDPGLATMLVWIGTDVDVPGPDGNAVLGTLLQQALDHSLNRISVDGDQSTNDTVLLMASGASGVRLAGDEDHARFQAALTELLQQIGRMIVRDGEGANHCVRIRIAGASSDAKAEAVARHISRSQLVKTAIFGHDPNWGRIAASAGAAEPELDPAQLQVSIGSTCVFQQGVPLAPSQLEPVSRYLAENEDVDILVDLAMGTGAAEFWTSDLGYEYVRINAEYTS